MGTKERLEILNEKYSNVFPEGVEAIVMTEDDYERLTGINTINDLLKRISNLEFEVEKLNNIIETTKIFVEKYNDKPFDIELREMILKCLNDEVKGSDKE